MALLATQTETAGMADDERSDFEFIMGMVRLWFPAVFSLLVMYYTYTNIFSTPPGFLLFWGVMTVGSAYYGVRKTFDNPLFATWFLPVASAAVAATLYISVRVKLWEVVVVALAAAATAVFAVIKTQKLQRR